MEERYSRLQLIPWWDQSRLRAAAALVVGAGALGNELVKNLTLLGLGTIYVIDMDKIETSNLARSVLFREADVGHYKATTVAKRAMELNPDVTAIPFIGTFEDTVGLGLVKKMDLVFGGLDSRLARLNLGRACRLVGKAWIDGAIEALQGLVRIFPATGPCYECTLNEIDLELISKRKSCALISKEEAAQGKIPTTPTMASIVAGYQVQEGIKLLHSERNLPTLLGRGLFVNGLTHDSYVITYCEKEDCPSHEFIDRYITLEISHTATLQELLVAARPHFGCEPSIFIRREVVISQRCQKCQTSESVGLPPIAWLQQSPVCAECGSKLQPVLGQNTSDFAPIMNRTLKECGVPDRDILMTHQEDALVGLELRPASAGKEEAA